MWLLRADPSGRAKVVALLAAGCLASCGGSANLGASGAATSGDPNVPVEVDLDPVPAPPSSAEASALEPAAPASATTAPPVRSPAALDEAKRRYITHINSLIRSRWTARCDADEGAVASGTITLTGPTITSVSDPSLNFLVGATVPAPPEGYPDLSIPSVSMSLRCAKKKALP